MPRLLAGAPLHVRKALRLQVHVYVVEAETGTAVGGGHVREPAWEPASVQVVVESIHVLHRAIDSAPVDGVCSRRCAAQCKYSWVGILQAADLSLSSCTRTPSAGGVRCVL